MKLTYKSTTEELMDIQQEFIKIDKSKRILSLLITQLFATALLVFAFVNFSLMSFLGGLAIWLIVNGVWYVIISKSYDKGSKEALTKRLEEDKDLLSEIIVTVGEDKLFVEREGLKREIRLSLLGKVVPKEKGVYIYKADGTHYHTIPSKMFEDRFKMNEFAKMITSAGDSKKMAETEKKEAKAKKKLILKAGLALAIVLVGGLLSIASNTIDTSDFSDMQNIFIDFKENSSIDDIEDAIFEKDLEYTIETPHLFETNITITNEDGEELVVTNNLGSMSYEYTKTEYFSNSDETYEYSSTYSINLMTKEYIDKPRIILKTENTREEYNSLVWDSPQKAIFEVNKLSEQIHENDGEYEFIGEYKLTNEIFKNAELGDTHGKVRRIFRRQGFTIHEPTGEKYEAYIPVIDEEGFFNGKDNEELRLIFNENSKGQMILIEMKYTIRKDGQRCEAVYNDTEVYVINDGNKVELDSKEELIEYLGI